MHKIGLIPSPGVSRKHLEAVLPDVKEKLNRRINDEQNWIFETHVDLMIGSAEDVHESIDKAAKMKDQHDWDFVVCITDLPSISGNKVVISDFNNDKQVAMLSLPSLGWIDLRRKLRKSLTILFNFTSYS